MYILLKILNKAQLLFLANICSYRWSNLISDLILRMLYCKEQLVGR